MKPPVIYLGLCGELPGVFFNLFFKGKILAQRAWISKTLKAT
jgi:hypothetical protein